MYSFEGRSGNLIRTVYVSDLGRYSVVCIGTASETRDQSARDQSETTEYLY